MELQSFTTYTGLSSVSNIPMHTSTIGVPSMTQAIPGIDTDIDRLYTLVEIAKDKFKEIDERLTTLEAKFTTLQLHYYKRFEE